MFQELANALGPGALQRLTLVLNHVLGQEPQATGRLRPHAGKQIHLQVLATPPVLPLPIPLPAPPDLPPLAWRVTPAGLLEWCGDEPPATPALTVRADLGDPLRLPLRLASGERPPTEVLGDAALAGDVNWLLQNLRWDVADDVERVLPAPAAALVLRVGPLLAGGLQAAVKGLQGLAALRPGPRGAAQS